MITALSLPIISSFLLSEDSGDKRASGNRYSRSDPSDRTHQTIEPEDLSRRTKNSDDVLLFTTTGRKHSSSLMVTSVAS